MARNKYNNEKAIAAVKDSIFNNYKARFEEYDAEVAEWYEDKPGYQFPHCIHGTSLITDYDNICGGCEDDSIPNSWDAEAFEKIAQEEAEYFCADLQKRADQVRILWDDSEIAAKPGDWINRKYIEWISELHKELDGELFRKLGL